MMTTASIGASGWLTFLLVSLAATFSPGPGVLLAISTTLAMGMRRTAYSSAGNALGVFLVACASVTGVGLLFQRSATAFMLLKLGGAAYLVYLGLRQWQVAAAPAALPLLAPDQDPRRRTAFRRGLMVALSNPKSILFFTAVFPQFMPASQAAPARFLLLSLTFVACALLSHVCYALAAGVLGARLLDARAMAWFRRVSAVLFVILGLALLGLSAGGA